MSMLGTDQALRTGVNRRQVLAWGSGTALALVFGQLALAREPVTSANFLELSGRLLEKDAASLDGAHAETYFANLTQQGEQDALAALFDGAANPALEQQIVNDWYSGVQRTADGEVVVTYTDALIWDALDYTKPQGWCGGETGYWADAPAGEA